MISDITLVKASYIVNINKREHSRSSHSIIFYIFHLYLFIYLWHFLVLFENLTSPCDIIWYFGHLFSFIESVLTINSCHVLCFKEESFSVLTLNFSLWHQNSFESHTWSSTHHNQVRHGSLKPPVFKQTNSSLSIAQTIYDWFE